MACFDSNSRRRRRCTWFVGLMAACTSVEAPLPPEIVDRYESCTDPAGRAAYEAALVHVQAGRDREALPLLRSAVETCPEHVRAHLRYQDAARVVGGDAEKSMRAYYETLPAAQVSPVTAYVKARLLPDRASRLEALERILRRSPSFYWAHLSTARVYRSIDRNERATESYRSALALNRDLLEAHLELAETLVDLGRYAEAESHYASFVRAVPNDRDARRDYLRLLVYRLRSIDVAEPLVAEMSSQDPEDVGLLMDKAAVDWFRGRLEAALRGYRRVLELQPDAARAAFNIGNIYFEALGADDASRRRYWPLARDAYLDYLSRARPEDGADYVERYLTVPYRLDVIAEFLGAAPDGAPR